jgi:hypothetical protein
MGHVGHYVQIEWLLQELHAGQEAWVQGRKRTFVKPGNQQYPGLGLRFFHVSEALQGLGRKRTYVGNQDLDAMFLTEAHSVGCSACLDNAKILLGQAHGDDIPHSLVAVEQ